MNFPLCTDTASLSTNLDNWLLEKQEYGNDIPSDLMYDMFLDRLPTSVAREVRMEKDISTAKQGLQYVHTELSRLNRERLAQAHAAERQMRLAPHKGDSDYIHAAISPPDDLVQQKVAAVENECRSSSPRTPRQPPPRQPRGPPSTRSDQKWKDGACWHCGKKGKTSKSCKWFIALNNAHGGKRPDNYVSACDKQNDNKKDRLQLQSNSRLRLLLPSLQLVSRHQNHPNALPLSRAAQRSTMACGALKAPRCSRWVYRAPSYAQRATDCREAYMFRKQPSRCMQKPNLSPWKMGQEWAPDRRDAHMFRTQPSRCSQKPILSHWEFTPHRMGPHCSGSTTFWNWMNSSGKTFTIFSKMVM